MTKDKIESLRARILKVLENNYGEFESRNGTKVFISIADKDLQNAKEDLAKLAWLASRRKKK